MAKPASKGTVLQREVSAVFTTIVSIKNISGPDMRVITGEVGSLDGGVGLPYDVTGHVEGGSVTGDGYMDAALSNLQILTDDITTPAKVNWKILWGSAATVWAFSGIMERFNPSARFNAFIMFDFGVKVDGIPTLPT